MRRFAAAAFAAVLIAAGTVSAFAAECTTVKMANEEFASSPTLAATRRRFHRRASIAYHNALGQPGVLIAFFAKGCEVVSAHLTEDDYAALLLGKPFDAATDSSSPS